MTNIKLATDNRKAAAQRLAEIIGGTSRYTKVPRCAYEVGPYFIEKDGTVSDRKIVKSASPSLDAEAMRVAKLMTSKWKPAMDKGKNVRTRFIVPFAFKLK